MVFLQIATVLYKKDVNFVLTKMRDFYAMVLAFNLDGTAFST